MKIYIAIPQIGDTLWGGVRVFRSKAAALKHAKSETQCFCYVVETSFGKAKQVFIRK
jgi:hypothetical protein